MAMRLRTARTIEASATSRMPHAVSTVSRPAQTTDAPRRPRARDRRRARMRPSRNALGIDVAEHDERVGERGLRAAAAVARGPRVGACRLRARPGSRPTESTHASEPPPEPTESTSTIDSEVQCPSNDAAVAAQRLAVGDERDVERRAAEVARDDVRVVAARAPARWRRPHPRRGPTARGRSAPPERRRRWSRRRSSA